LDPVSDYANRVLIGEVPACKWVKLACERFVRDLERKDLVFDTKQVASRIAFFRDLLVLENGEPFVLPDWQEFIVGNLYGWKIKKTGKRRFQQGLVLVPRKNAKSTLISGLGLSSFLMDGVTYSQFYCLASDRGQASLLKDYGEGFVKRHEELPNAVQIRTWEMRCPAFENRWKALHADYKRLDGLNPYFVVFDEFHTQETDGLDNVINSAFGSQSEYLYLKITTAGEYKREKPCVKQQKYGEQVLEGVIERDNLFYMNYTIDEGDNWADPEIWQKANPNLGISKNLDYMEDLAKEAALVPSRKADFLTKQLNVWVESLSAWINKEVWDACGTKTIREATLHGLKCYGGLDLAQVEDLTALVYVFPPQAHLKKMTVLCRFFIPEENIIERSTKHRVPYDRWRNGGHVIATPGNITDYNFVEKAITEDSEKFNIQTIGYDRTFSGHMSQNLINNQIDMAPFKQSFYHMGPAVAETQRLIIGKEIEHGANPVLDWCSSNAVVRFDANGNMLIDKAKSYEKVDGMVALAMAIGTYQLTDKKESVYEDRDIRVL